MGRHRSKNAVRKTVKCLKNCLDKNIYPLTLKWVDYQNQIFSILFKHKKSRKWNKEYLAFFKEWDKLSTTKSEKYEMEQDSDQACKRRGKANLRKLCQDGVLEFIKKKIIDKTTKEMFYKFSDISMNNETSFTTTFHTSGDEKFYGEGNSQTLGHPLRNNVSHYKQDRNIRDEDHDGDNSHLCQGATPEDWEDSWTEEVSASFSSDSLSPDTDGETLRRIVTEDTEQKNSQNRRASPKVIVCENVLFPVTAFDEQQVVFENSNAKNSDLEQMLVEDKHKKENGCSDSFYPIFENYFKDNVYFVDELGQIYSSYKSKDNIVVNFGLNDLGREMVLTPTVEESMAAPFDHSANNYNTNIDSIFYMEESTDVKDLLEMVDDRKPFKVEENNLPFLSDCCFPNISREMDISQVADEL